MTSRLWTAANAVMLLLFALSAALQLNDPDPVVWMAIYGAAAAVCWLEIRRRATLWPALALALGAFVGAAVMGGRARDVPLASLFAEWEMKDLRIEEAREMYGLAIVGAWMTAIVVARWARGKRPGVE